MKHRVERFLTNPTERPLLGILRNIMYGILVGILLTLINSWLGISRLSDVFAYLLIGCGLSFSGWCAERLWYSIISGMMHQPFAWYAYCTRLPFWYIAGGIGYILGLLIAKKSGLIFVYDIPIKQYFVLGAKMEIILQSLLQIRVYRSLRRTSSVNY